MSPAQPYSACTPHPRSLALESGIFLAGRVLADTATDLHAKARTLLAVDPNDETAARFNAEAETLKRAAEILGSLS